MSHDELVDLEEQGWRALCSSGEAAAEFYERVLDGTVVMLLPGPMLLDDRATIIQSMSGEPWSSHQLRDIRVVPITEDTAVVVYGVVARRGDGPEYSALISSSYARRRDGWKLTVHQQTPS